MKKAIALLGALLLVSCGEVPNTGADGYKFGTKEYDLETVQVSKVYFKSVSQFQKSAKDRGIENWDSVAAYSVLQPGKDSCTIYMVDPETAYEPEYAGHELFHCFHGRWHP